MKRKLIKTQKDRWERGFAALSKFRRRKGHCCPPRYHLEGKYKLGQWVTAQRYLKDKLSVERKKRLDRIGFVWNWRDFVWERGFAALLKFKRREGHCCCNGLAAVDLEWAACSGWNGVARSSRCHPVATLGPVDRCHRHDRRSSSPAWLRSCRSRSHAALARRALLRVDTMAAPYSRPVGVSHPELPRLRSARLPGYPLQAILR
jgi:hypothetical protein